MNSARYVRESAQIIADCVSEGFVAFNCATGGVNVYCSQTLGGYWTEPDAKRTGVWHVHDEDSIFSEEVPVKRVGKRLAELCWDWIVKQSSRRKSPLRDDCCQLTVPNAPGGWWIEAEGEKELMLVVGPPSGLQVVVMAPDDSLVKIPVEEFKGWLGPVEPDPLPMPWVDQSAL